MDTRVVRERGGGSHLAAKLLPVLSEQGYDLVWLSLDRGKTRRVRIMAERSDGSMKVEDCEHLVRLLTLLPEEQSGLRESDEIEVSSPGVERPLSRMRDLQEAVGARVRLLLRTPIEGARRYSATLAEVSASGIVVQRQPNRSQRRARRKAVEAEQQDAQVSETAAPVSISFGDIEWISRELTEDEFRQLLKARALV